MDNKKTPSGNNGVIITLIVLAVVAVGALAYISGQVAGNQTTTVADAQSDETQSADAQDIPEIVPGNPVVAKVGGQDIERAEVISYMRSLPPQVQQLPLEQIFPAALEQIVNEKLVRMNAEKANLDNDPQVKEKLAAAKKEIIATVFLQKAIDAQVNDDNLQKAYDEYVAGLQPVEEAKASHILVDDEKRAIELIQELEAGADFSKLAEEYSKDIVSAKKGGDIGYFSENEVVPEFAEAAFAQEVGKHSFKPVKSQFGYHIILVEDRRTRPTPTMEDVKPILEGKIRQAALQDLFAEWRSAANIEVFDINGNAIEPAAGDETAAETEAESSQPAE